MFVEQALDADSIPGATGSIDSQTGQDFRISSLAIDRQPA